jgi:hypothetical protein
MIYICAGMPRSGSTWLFNAVRMILRHAGAPDLAGGYVGQMKELVTHQTALIKLHPFDAGLVARADVILTSHRDLRDVAASMQRHYQDGYSALKMNEWVRSQIKWAQFAAYDLHYERLLSDRLAVIREIAAVLKLPAPVLGRLDYDAILREIDGQKFSRQFSDNTIYDAVNLLHEGHITDGRHGSWPGVVPDEAVASIEREFRGFLVHRGYLRPSAGKPLDSRAVAPAATP